MKKILIILLLSFGLLTCKKGENNNQIIFDQGTNLNPTINSNGGEIPVKFATNSQWSAIVDSENISWCSISSTNGDAGNASLIITIKSNPTYDDRTATISIQSDDANKTIHITQTKLEIILVSSSSFNVPHKGGKIEIDIQANSDYNIDIKSDWITQSVNKSLTKKTLIFNVSKNNMENQRNGEIEFSLPDNTITKVSIVQNGMYVNIPDLAFKSYLISNFDLNNDSKISDEEALSVTKIECKQLEISSLKGVSYFSNLTVLDCSFNKLTSLNISSCTSLINLNCSFNQLSSFDTSTCPSLTNIDCNFNILTTLDLSANTALTNLNCSSNQLTTLDLSKTNMNGGILTCASMETLKTLILKTNWIIDNIYPNRDENNIPTSTEIEFIN